MAKKHLQIGPDGDLFDMAGIRSTRVTENGVIMLGENGRFLHMIKEEAPERAKKIRDEIVRMVMAIGNNEKYAPPQWPGQAISSVK